MPNPIVGQSQLSAHHDAIFRALAEETRRHVLQYFQSSSETVASTDDLVAYTLTQNGAQDDTERIAVKLHHATLPMLDDAGLIEYDAQSDHIRYRENPQIKALLNHVTATVD